MRFDKLVSPVVQQRMLEIAREFRRESAPSEALLWDAVRRKQVKGFKFRRQQPIGSFVVDFYCDEAGLIVEVDGPIHKFQQAKDRERQDILESLGLTVLRLSADEVEADIAAAVSRIEAELPDGPEFPSPSGRGVRGEGVRYGK